MIPKSGHLVALSVSLFAISICVLSAIVYVEPEKSVVHTSPNLDTREQVVAAVSTALVHPRSVIFVHVDWAIYQPHRDQFQAFATAWSASRPHVPISFHDIDFTTASEEYTPITELPGWSETRQRIGRQPFAGNGEYAWILDGQLVDIGWPGFVNPESLIEKADRVFRLTRE